jgi:hypothetical protein
MFRSIVLDWLCTTGPCNHNLLVHLHLRRQQYVFEVLRDGEREYRLSGNAVGAFADQLSLPLRRVWHL